jgi:hypothetical protein
MEIAKLRTRSFDIVFLALLINPTISLTARFSDRMTKEFLIQVDLQSTLLGAVREERLGNPSQRDVQLRFALSRPGRVDSRSPGTA